mmetsp:Transcript_29472/g.32790  ORF Transcript_29472/g.32790 Transcript_29472/m.32790 type:complete len:186 (+) Transcript_29472:63-620(+)
MRRFLNAPRMARIDGGTIEGYWILGIGFMTASGVLISLGLRHLGLVDDEAMRPGGQTNMSLQAGNAVYGQYAGKKKERMKRISEVEEELRVAYIESTAEYYRRLKATAEFEKKKQAIAKDMEATDAEKTEKYADMLDLRQAIVTSDSVTDPIELEKHHVPVTEGRSEELESFFKKMLRINTQQGK